VAPVGPVGPVAPFKFVLVDFLVSPVPKSTNGMTSLSPGVPAVNSVIFLSDIFLSYK
jgi:hypothetical protein